MVLIDSCEALGLAAQTLRVAAMAGAPLAVDCEGKDLSRTGPLCVLQVATPEECFVVDVQELGSAATASELRDLLEDAETVKLMFDCRRDSDALFHQLGIRLQGVRDLQLKEFIGREESPAEHTKSLAFLGKNVGREPHIYEQIYQLHSLKRCLADLEISDAAEFAIKQQITKQFREDSNFWLRRPLPADAVRYAEQDVVALFAIDAQLPEVPLDVWRAASLAYESIFRDSASGRENAFLEHGFLPLHVVPGVPPCSSGPSRMCSGCLRTLPSSTVAHSLRGTALGTKYCALCYAIGVMHRNRAFAEERRSHEVRGPTKYKLAGSGDAGVKPCAFVRRPGGCRNGSACKFSHA